MATATETPSVSDTETPKGGSRPGRKAKEKFLEHLSKKFDKKVVSLSAVPSIPDDYDPEVFGSLREPDFDDALHYYQWLTNYHGFFAARAEAKAERLSKMAPELRNDVSVAEKSTDSIILHLRKLAAKGHDISGLLAKISTDVGG